MKVDQTTSLRLAAKVPGYVRWAFAAFSTAAGVAASISAAMDGLPLHEILLYGSFVWAASLTGVILLVALIDRGLEFVPSWIEGRRVANLLEEIDRVGHTEITLGEASGVWAAEESDPRGIVRHFEANIKLRKLKMAVSQGLIKSDLPLGELPPMKTSVKTTDLASFFSSRKWLEIKEQEWPKPREQ